VRETEVHSFGRRSDRAMPLPSFKGDRKKYTHQMLKAGGRMQNAPPSGQVVRQRFMPLKNFPEKRPQFTSSKFDSDFL